MLLYDEGVLNYTACLTVIGLQFLYGNMVKNNFAEKIAGVI